MSEPEEGEVTGGRAADPLGPATIWTGRKDFIPAGLLKLSNPVFIAGVCRLYMYNINKYL